MDKSSQLFNTPPTHLSVGAVLVDNTGQILCHHFTKTPWENLENVFVLMRETAENNEPMETAVRRGLMEEFGATGKITKYLGPIISHYPEEGSDDPTTEKTTLYFLVELQSIDPAGRDQSDPEKDSNLEWHPAGYLITKMRDQLRRYPNRADLDESNILQRL